MDVEPEHVDQLVQAVREELGDDPERWLAPSGYASVALAVLDAIYSPGNHYTGVVNALNRYCAARREEGWEPSADTARDLVESVDRWGGAPGLVERTSAWRTSTEPGSPTRAEAAYAAARVLLEHGLSTVDDVRAQLTDPDRRAASEVRDRWLALPGQGSELTWTYFLMLCGVPGVRADRLVVRYVTRAAHQSVDAEEATALVAAAARRLGVDAARLDHALWRLESGRPVEYD